MIKNRAFRIHKEPFRAGFETVQLGDPEAGNVLVKIYYSGVNYKDALAGTGTAPIIRRDVLTGGIDLAGVVERSTVAWLKEGDAVLATGSGLGEIYDGGYASYAIVPANILIPLPSQLDLRSAMIIGTAGFTAALCLERMLQNDQSPELGEVVVTGASGGVGSFAVHFLKKLGFATVAATHKKQASDYLKSLGADRVIDAIEPQSGALAKAVWGGAIDNLGGDTLATLLKTTHNGGNVVSVGLAQSSALNTSVMPLIIRGLSLLGVTSANCPMRVKQKIWQSLGDKYLPTSTNAMLCEEASLEDLPTCFERLLSRQVQGRILIDCRS
ncbi:MAG: YhdH/YhfP family quinone oxidoreductase [Chromatiales bacterium]|nr:YhdH/YhfP family quinone oxidoreductase [Chromatiales bacterium]